MLDEVDRIHLHCMLSKKAIGRHRVAVQGDWLYSVLTAHAETAAVLSASKLIGHQKMGKVKTIRVKY